MIAEALRTLARGLRYNVTQARADLDQMAANGAKRADYWTGDMLAHQGYQNGRIAVMEDVANTLEIFATGTAAVIVDVDSWARWPEVQEFARRHAVSEAQAVRLLVNAGLTHEPESYVVTPAGPREESDEDAERAYEAANLDPIALRGRGVFAEVEQMRPAQKAARDRAAAEHQTHAYPSRDRRGYWQAVCAGCGPVGDAQRHEYAADAIAAEHRKDQARS